MENSPFYPKRLSGKTEGHRQDNDTRHYHVVSDKNVFRSVSAALNVIHI